MGERMPLVSSAGGGGGWVDFLVKSTTSSQSARSFLSLQNVRNV